ncbi:MAG: hypothetical protein ABS92_06810 [Thiobacillus sp. SCN 63-374]|nr:MAG: hypothetical protein ABS92_06810 [Thiobacillus sp. SCN 63-374]
MSLKGSLNRLEQLPPADKKLPAATTPVAIRASAALFERGGGIASPLVETAYASRSWHPAQTLTSTDGVFTFSVRFIKTLGMTDANGAGVALEFKDKP